MKLVKFSLSIAMLISLVACNNNLASTSQNSLQALTTDNATFNVSALSEELKAKYPTLQSELDALKTLTPDQRKTKMDELKTKYPELATLKGKDGFGKGGHGGPKGKGGFGGSNVIHDFANSNAQFKADLDALRASGKTQMDALIAKYPDLKTKIDAEKKARLDQLKAVNPELGAEVEKLEAQNLSPEEMKTKMDELRQKYPMKAPTTANGTASAQKPQGARPEGFGKGGHGGPKGKGGFGGPEGHGGKGGSNVIHDFANSNAQFKADLDALRASEKTQMDALIAKYPELKAKIDAEKKARLDQLKAVNPELGAEVEKLEAQNLSPEEMKTKMDELRQKYPMKIKK